MTNNRTIKFVVVLLAVLQLLALPGFALAQFAVPSCDSGNGLCDVAGTLANTAANTALATIDSTNLSTCTAPEQAFAKTDKAISIGMGGLALISGGAALQGQLTKKIGQYEVFKTCHQAQLQLAKAVPTPNTFTSNRKQLLVDEITKQIASLVAKEEPLNNQLKMAQAGFWKVLVFNILIKTTKTVAINMVNKLVKDYHITDFSKYADAIATQVYDNEFILDNFSGSTADQMMIRSMLSNPLAQSQIQPNVFQYANTALGFDPNTLNTSDPNYFQKLFFVGSGNTNPFVQQAAFSDASQMIHNKSLVTAQAEIAQSAGLKTPRNCAGTISQQKSLDQSYKSVSDQLNNRQALFNNLVNAQSLNYPVNPADITKAQNDLAAAQKQWDALPNSVSSPIVSICAAIVSPPSLISKGIDQAFSSYGKTIGTYNNNNMPFFINAISDVANEITNDLIFAGGVNGSQLLNENVGNLTQASSILTSSGQAAVQVQQSSNLVATTNLNSLSADNKTATFDFNWDANAVTDATAVSVTGPGVPTALAGLMLTSLGGSMPVTVPVGAKYSYTVTAYGKSHADVKATVTVQIDATNVVPKPVVPATTTTPISTASSSASSLACTGGYTDRTDCLNSTGGQVDFCDQMCGKVSGAFTSLVPVSPRGPMPVIRPRGE